MASVSVIDIDKVSTVSDPIYRQREFAYITKDGDLVDYIAWRYYGSAAQAATEAIIDRNPTIADYPPTLPAGVTIILPVLDTRSAKVSYLWDREGGSA